MAGTAGRRGRAMLVGILASVALPLPGLTGMALAAPADPAKAATAKAVAMKVTPAVRAEVAADDKSTFWVVLAEEANLAKANATTDKDEKAAAVYEAKTDFARASQAGVRKLLDNRKADYTSYWISNSLQVTGNAKLLGEIATRPEVARIEADTAVALPKPIKGEQLAEVNAVEWNIDRVNAPRVWNELGTRGEGIVVANIDSGVSATTRRSSTSTAARTPTARSTTTTTGSTRPGSAPPRRRATTTATAPTRWARWSARRAANQVGVAPGAKWIAAKGCETSSCSRDSLLASGQWVVAPTNLTGANPRPDLAPDIVNNSWGWLRFPTRGTRTSSARGSPPGSSRRSRTATAGRAATPPARPASYVSQLQLRRVRHQQRDLQLLQPRPRPERRRSSRTSPRRVRTCAPRSRPATPASAARRWRRRTPRPSVALMWSASPALHGNIEDTKQLLDTTAIDVDATTCGGTAADNNVFGEGRIDAYAAVSAAPRGATRSARRRRDQRRYRARRARP